jgi:shikimate kinase
VNFFICGFTGAGKTTFLKNLVKANESVAARFKFLDLDQVILQKFPKYKTLADLITDLGFPKFRQLEFECIKNIAQEENVILALGGGSLREDTASSLKDWKGLWLNESFEVCYSRIRGDESRPITNSSEKDLEELYISRRKFYSENLEITGISQVVEIILSY